MPLYMRLEHRNIDGQYEPTSWIPHKEEKVYFSAYCMKCNEGMCREFEGGTVEIDGKIRNILIVSPCPNCGGGYPDKEFPEKYLEARRDPKDAVQEDH